MRITGRVQISVIREEEYIKEFEKAARPEIASLAESRLDELFYNEDFSFEDISYTILLTSGETIDGRGRKFHFRGCLSADGEGVGILMRYVEVTEE